MAHPLDKKDEVFVVDLVSTDGERMISGRRSDDGTRVELVLEHCKLGKSGIVVPYDKWLEWVAWINEGHVTS
jgi:hypothetical protein